MVTDDYTGPNPDYDPVEAKRRHDEYRKANEQCERCRERRHDLDLTWGGLFCEDCIREIEARRRRRADTQAFNIKSGPGIVSW